MPYTWRCYNCYYDFVLPFLFCKNKIEDLNLYLLGLFNSSPHPIIHYVRKQVRPSLSQPLSCRPHMLVGNTALFYRSCRLCISRNSHTKLAGQYCDLAPLWTVCPCYTCELVREHLFCLNILVFPSQPPPEFNFGSRLGKFPSLQKKSMRIVLSLIFLSLILFYGYFPLLM